MHFLLSLRRSQFPPWWQVYFSSWESYIRFCRRWILICCRTSTISHCRHSWLCCPWRLLRCSQRRMNTSVYRQRRTYVVWRNSIWAHQGVGCIWWTGRAQELSPGALQSWALMVMMTYHSKQLAECGWRGSFRTTIVSVCILHNYLN